MKNSGFMLFIAIITQLGFLNPVAHAEPGCKSHFSKLEKRTSMGILTMVNKAMKDGQALASSNGYILEIKKSGECTAELQIYGEQNEARLCTDKIITCASKSAESPAQAATKIKDIKLAVDNKLNELEEQGRAQMKEKEQKLADHIKTSSPVQKKVEPALNEYGEHELIIILNDNADMKDVARHVKDAKARFDNKLYIKELKIMLISVPVGNSQALFDKLKRNPHIKNVDFNYPTEFQSNVPTPNGPMYGSSWHLSKISAP